MRVRFTATADDVVDATIRVYRRVGRRVDGRVREAIEQRASAETPFELEVWLAPEGVHFTQKNSPFLQKWDVVEGIEVDGGDVLFPMRDGGILIVRSRAFGSNEARQRFVELANQFRAGSGARSFK